MFDKWSYTAPQAIKAGLAETREQLHQWISRGYLEVSPSRGPGLPRDFTYADLLRISLFRALVIAGIPGPTAGHLIRAAEDREPRSAYLIIVSDGEGDAAICADEPEVLTQIRSLNACMVVNIANIEAKLQRRLRDMGFTEDALAELQRDLEAKDKIDRLASDVG